MDLSLAFTELVFSMCALDLLWSASVRVDTWWHDRLSPLTSGLVSAKSAVNRPQKRGDWYVFFHCADLVGTDSARSDHQPRSEMRVASKTTVRPRPTINL